MWINIFFIGNNSSIREMAYFNDGDKWTKHLILEICEIVKTKLSRLVMETLNSQAITQQKLYEFMCQIQCICQKDGIEFVEADKWDSSSKTCSFCMAIKSDLKLKDHDLNASIQGA